MDMEVEDTSLECAQGLKSREEIDFEAATILAQFKVALQLI